MNRDKREHRKNPEPRVKREETTEKGQIDKYIVRICVCMQVQSNFKIYHENNHSGLARAFPSKSNPGPDYSPANIRTVRYDTAPMNRTTIQQTSKYVSSLCFAVLG